MDEKKKPTLLFSAIEEKILKFWRENNIFEKSVQRRRDKTRFVFYEGPPYANGAPGIHHVETRTFKDAIARYKTMRGYYVPRQAGWDTHGLPTEIAAEKTLGIKSKRDIEEKVGIEAFVKAARENVFLYKAEWEKMTARMGYWLDMSHPYVTMENFYIESLWAIIKRISDRGLLYEADKVLPWCLRCGTALSFHELAQGYKTITDKAITVKFEVLGSAAYIRKSDFRTKTYFLAWTTTPWTLPGNAALAVNPDAEYIIVESLGGSTARLPMGGQANGRSDRFIVAKNLAERLFPHANILETKKGSELVGLTYEPLYEVAMPLLASLAVGGSDEEREKIYRVVAEDFVSTEEGTGIVHIAPAFGEDDMRAGRENNLSILRTVDEEGKFKKEVRSWHGQLIWDANEKIIEDLKARGLLLKEENYEHDYPFCWRCDSKVIYFAKPSWWIKMSALRDQLVRENQTIQWHPPHLRDGRFGEWLREAKDWAFSRERYWGTPLPVWQCGSCQGREVIGALGDLKNRAARSGNRYIIMRHGEAGNNAKNIINSSLSTNHYFLTARGRKQVRASAERLRVKRITPDMIFASPFLRAQETATILAATFGIEDSDVKIDPRIGEIDTGVFDGKPSQEYHAFFSDLSERFIKAPIGGGETVRDIARRAFAAVSEIESRYQNKTIIIVAHEYLCWALWMVARGATNEEAIAEKTKRGDDFLSTAQFEEIDFMPIPRDNTGALDMHKPYVDSVVLRCGVCGGAMRRVPEVIDVWFDSGAMPFASRHWPFAGENIPYPADYICEAIDQTRGWFYTLLAVGVLLERGTPYKNVVSLGLVLDEDGKKMSKSRGNVVDPWQLFETYGADAVRWYFFTINQPWDEKRFAEKDIADVSRRFLMILWNCFQFWKMYAKNGRGNEKLEVGGKAPAPPRLLINKWILAQLDELIVGVTLKMDSYDIVGASRDLEHFVVEDFSRWYIRRIRDVIKNEADNSARQETTETLRVVLLEISKLLAPFTPFIAEELYRELGGSAESVHWEDWLIPGQIDAHLLSSMSLVRSFASMALMKRSEENIKVRQPLQRFSIKHNGKAPEYWDELKEILKDEINVKEIILEKGKGPDFPPFELDTAITAELKEEGILRDVIRAIQARRKEAGLKPGVLADVSIAMPADIARVVEQHRDAIARDTSARAITTAAGEILAIQVI